MSQLDFFVSIVDLVVIATVIGVFGFTLISGVLRSRRPLPPAAYIIATGMVVAVISHISDLILRFVAIDIGEAASFTATLFSATWWHWAASRVAFGLIAIGLVGMVISRRRIEDDLTSNDALIEDLRSSTSKANEHFRYLFETTSDSVYCYALSSPISVHAPLDQRVAATIDAELQQANEVFVRELESDDIDAVIGQKFGVLDSARDEPAHAAMVAAFVESGYRLENYALNYKTPAGEDRALNVNWIGVVCNGRLERFWGVENNQLEFRETQAELAHRRTFGKLIADISSRLVAAQDEKADAAIQDCIGKIANYIGVDRTTTFWLGDGNPASVSIANRWARPGIKPFDSAVSAKLFCVIQKQIRRNQVVQIDSVANIPDEYAADQKDLQRFGVKSLLALPLAVADEAIGGMTLGNVVDEKIWTEQTVADAKVFAKMLASAVLRLKSRRALADALQGLQKATERLTAENVFLREEVGRKHSFHEIIGESSGLLSCLKQVEQVAETRTPVLVYGETGTGKELIARAIHDRSNRSDRPLVKVNCAALPVNLIESELFGHEKGAFTGAESKKLGRFDLADGSTLFLDEIGEIPVSLQAKLLRVLQEGEFDRLGGTKTIKVDVRLVVATNRDLGTAAHTGEFRSDLYYRINTFPIELPALRERGDDIELLARHFVKLHAQRLGRDVQEISAETMRQLRSYNWPGNIRELEGIIQRALISNSGPVVELAEPLVVFDAESEERTIISSTITDLKLVERDHLVTVLDESHWKISGGNGAAAKLGIPPSTLRSKMKKLGIIRRN